jgi:pimeloyl-ACP methyl ester carboxylesterase
VQLAKGFRVYAMDLPAHGSSGVDPSPLTVQRAADAVVTVMDSLGLERAHLIGHSISGAVITRVAAQHPERVHRLVYLDATFDWGGPDEAEMDRLAVPRPEPAEGFKTPAEGEAWARKYFYGTWTPALTADGVTRSRINPNEVAERNRQHSVLLMDATLAPKEYASLRAPALAIWGEKTRDSYFFWIDRTDSATLARADIYLAARRRWEKRGVDRFRREAKGGRVVNFPAHHAMFITAPDRTLAEITRFLTGG